MGATKFKYSKSPIVYLDRDIEMTPTLINNLLTGAMSQKGRYDCLENYYNGVHDILYRYFEDESKPNNKVVNNFASYIVDVRTGYFSGIPLTYNSKNQKMLEDVKRILTSNSSSDVTNEIDRLTNIHGHAFELFWINEEGELRFKQVPANEMTIVYSADIENEPLYAIRRYKNESITGQGTDEYITVYDKTMVYEYKRIYGENADDFYMNPTNVYPHMFNELPIIEYVNNEYRTASFEDVTSLIDAYNIAESDSINDIQYFNDSYLVIKNMLGTTSDDISEMKQNRVMVVDGDGDVAWLTKNINDTYLEHIKERIAKDIHKFSKTPNLVSDEFVSNLSGTAIRYKVWGLEQDSASKERKWRVSLNKRLRLITFYLNIKGNSYDYRDIEITFNRNMPQNVTELGQMATQLAGLVSRETLLAQLPFVENVEAELQRFEKEQEAQAEVYGEMFAKSNTVEPDINERYKTGQKKADSEQ